MTSHPDEGTLHAYIDGELPAREATALEAHVRACGSCATALAEARGFVAAASRAISALDTAPSSGSRAAAPAGMLSAPSVGTRRAFRVPFARAAALLLLAGGTAVVVNNSGTRGTSYRASESARRGPVAPEAANAPAQSVVSDFSAVAELRAEAQDASPFANPPRERAARNAPAAAVSTRGDDAALKSAGSTLASTEVAGRVAGVAGGTATRDRAAAVPVAPPVLALESAPAVQPRRPESVVAEVTVIPPSPPSAPARAEPTQESALAAAAPSVRVTRLRTKAGVVLTLTEEPIRTSFADNATLSRRSVLRPAPMSTSQSSGQTRAAAAGAPVMKSYRWTSVEQGRTYTLTGPMSVAELEATARRLGELERIP